MIAPFKPFTSLNTAFQYFSEVGSSHCSGCSNPFPGGNRSRHCDFLLYLFRMHGCGDMNECTPLKKLLRESLAFSHRLQEETFYAFLQHSCTGGRQAVEAQTVIFTHSVHTVTHFLWNWLETVVCIHKVTLQPPRPLYSPLKGTCLTRSLPVCYTGIAVLFPVKPVDTMSYKLILTEQ